MSLVLGTWCSVLAVSRRSGGWGLVCAAYVGAWRLVLDTRRARGGEDGEDGDDGEAGEAAEESEEGV